MPKYYGFKVCGYYLYYTASCVIEAMHVHASDRRLTEAGSAKFFVKSYGDTTVEKQGQLNDREVRQIREFIKENYEAEHTLSFDTVLEDLGILCRRYGGKL